VEQTLSIAQARTRAKQLHAELARRVIEHRYYLQCEHRAHGPEAEAAFSRAWDEAVREWDQRFKRRR
jgi:hypothetical protein